MRDREILRSLAGQIAEIAARNGGQQETRELYRAVNDRRMIRPVVLIDELPWNQLDFDGSLTLQCEDARLRPVEQRFRRLLWQWEHCRCDMLMPDFCPVGNYHMGSIGVEVQENTLAADAGNNIVSHQYVDQFEDAAAIAKLHDIEIFWDREADARDIEWLGSLFGDLLPVRFQGVRYIYYAPWDVFSSWRGMQNALCDLIDDPQKVHALYRRYQDIHLRLLRRMEEMGLLEGGEAPTVHCTAGLTNDLHPPRAGETATRANIWGRGMAQPLAVVSPKMHAEFDIAYMQEYFRDFGLVYYGCCEPLSDKIDILRQIPNLRKISITPWADVRKAAEQMGKDYVMAWKPNPALVASPDLEEEAVRAEIRNALSACRASGTSMEITLKDISSVAHRPQNLARWAQIAMEMVQSW